MKNTIQLTEWSDGCSSIRMFIVSNILCWKSCCIRGIVNNDQSPLWGSKLMLVNGDCIEVLESKEEINRLINS